MRPTRSILNRLLPWAIAAASALALVAVAGSLEPPGPPEPTMKPLNELEPRHPIWPEMLPFTIGEPGAYYLAAPGLDVPGGITVVTPDVTIDLNGFTLKGATGSGVGIDASAVSRVTVFGGTVRNFPGGGISTGSVSTVHDVSVVATGGIGIQVGSYSRVLRSMATENSGDGIVVGWNAIIKDCLAGDNQGRGIVGDGATITGCTSRINASHGIEVGYHSLLVRNTCTDNGSLVPEIAAGILVTASGNRIEQNHLAANDIGLQITGTNNIVLRNTSTFEQGPPYSIELGNTRGPIVDASMVEDLSNVTHGDHPWANFVF